MENEQKFPLSHNQNSLFFMDRLIGGKPVYNLSAAIKFGKEIDQDILRGSMLDLFACNDALKTVFVTEPSGVFQVIKKDMSFSIPALNMEKASESEIMEMIETEKDRPFDLSKGPLVRAVLYKMAEGCIALIVMHHIISDFWTLAVLLKDLAYIYSQKVLGLNDYRARITGKPSYEIYVRRQEKILAQKTELADYWRSALSGELPVLNLNTDRPRPPVQSWNGGCIEWMLSQEDSGRIARFCKQCGIGKHVFLLSIFQLLLQKYTGQDDILVGSLATGRTSLKLSEITGYFINPVVIRGDLSGDPEFRVFLERVRQAALGAFAHKEYPFDLIVKQLELRRDLSVSPVFQALFAYQTLPNFIGSNAAAIGAAALNRSAIFDFGGISTEYIPLTQRTAQYDISLITAEQEEGTGLLLEYNSDLFDEETVQRMLKHYVTLLKSALDEPEKRLSELGVLDSEEREMELCAHNRTEMFYEPVCLHQLIERQAGRTPESLALVFDGAQLTYRALRERSGRLANFLRKQGLERNQPAVVCMERSAEMVVALLAALKAGAYYVPLDPTHPCERLTMILDDISKGGQPPLLLTQNKLLDMFPDYKGTVVCVDRDHSLIAQESAACPESGADSGNLAYTIYTSGSTAIPKGVKITHKSLVNFLESMRAEPGITAHDTLLAVTTASFDIAGLELWLPLISGAAVVLAGESEAMDGRILARLLEEHKVTIMQATPSTWRILCESGWKGRPGMKLLCGGEAFPPALAARLLEMCGEVWNLYGPTETTIWSSLYRVKKEADPIPIGHPIGNTYLYVLDAYQNPVPRGVSGELYIGGDGVAVGYTRDDETTRGKFLPDLFRGGSAARMYRTGDLVRRLPDGELEYLGRLDHQVKIRGYRIETGEIETALRLHPHVKDTLVIVTRTKTDVSQLVAYFIPSGEVRPEGLRQFLRDKLPEYMLPSFLIPLETFPLTPNGKIDRKKLPGPKSDRPNSDSGYIAPKSQAEKQLTNIFKEILGVEKVGIHDKFFDLGGNSILATILQNRIMEEFPGREVSIVDLFQHTSVAELSRFLQGEVSVEQTARAAVGTGIRAEGETPGHEDIAIVGMSCRFPKSENLQMFWGNLAEGRECITLYSEDELQKSGIAPEVYDDSRYVKASGSIDGIEQFDASFFNYSPKEAALIDPQQRIFLQEAWRALEDAGCVPEYFPGKIGVYAGVGMNDYITRNLSSHSSLFDGAGGYQLMISNDKDFVATRVSYQLNLTGPAVTVQTACSSSLTAVHMACQAIRYGECDMALAGGVSLRVPQKAGYTYNEGMILSPDGHCRAFDEKAKGTVIGSGAGVVALKPLMSAMRDGDAVYAVIKGSALNNDGSCKAAFTAPGPESQAAVIRDALRNAGVGADEISYVETHGTGTVIGDPIEITALTRAFDLDESARESCAIGSVKTNIGHLDAAAGVAGLIKTALALYHRKIPASLHFETPNPKINFKGSPFYVNTELADWESGGKPRYAGVSSFGIGGTNVHLILGEAPQPRETRSSEKKYKILTLSAKTPGSLAARVEDLRDYLTDYEDVSFHNAAFTLAVGRVPMRCRAAIVCDDPREASRLLREPDSADIFSGVTGKNGMRAAFLCPGQGSQYIDMGKALYQTEALFRETMDACFDLVLKYTGEDLKSVIYPTDADRDKAVKLLEQTANTQPAIFVLEYSLAKLLLSWGIKPAAMCGHSVGEYAAACLAGVFSLEDAIRLVTLRARLIGQLPEGKMLSVQLSEDALSPMLDAALSVAAVNGAENCVVSGPAESIIELSRRCTDMGIPAKTLSVSHAFHSSMLDPILTDFRDAVSGMELNPPSMGYVSSCTGRWIEDSEATDPEYWVRHLRRTVRFFDAAGVLLGLPDTVILEVGPGKALGSLLRRHPAKADQSLILNTLPHPLETVSADQSLYRMAARLWVAGVFDDWTGFCQNEPANRIHLPGYSFEKRRCWIEPGRSAVGSSDEDEATLFGDGEDEQQSVDVRSFLSSVYVPADSEDENALAEIWRDILGINTVGVTDDFFELGGTSLMLTQLLARMRQRFADLPLTIKGLYDNPTIRGAANYIETLRSFAGGEDCGGEYEEGEI